MTTIVYRDGILASDSRATAGNQIEGNYKKIHGVNGWLIGISGECASGEEFIAWFKSKTKGITAKAPVDFPKNARWSLSVLAISPKGEVFTYYDKTRPIRVLKEYHSVGSGKVYALGALAHGASAIEAVEAAKKCDTGSGGAIQTLMLGYHIIDKKKKRAAVAAKRRKGK